MTGSWWCRLRSGVGCGWGGQIVGTNRGRTVVAICPTRGGDMSLHQVGLAVLVGAIVGVVLPIVAVMLELAGSR